MSVRDSLTTFLSAEPGGADAPVARTVLKIAGAARGLSDLLSLGLLAETGLPAIPGINGAGDAQAALDIVANDMMLDALSEAPVAMVASEELDDVALLDTGAPLAVAMDPLDGSSNIGVNMSIGSIFGIRPAPYPMGSRAAAVFEAPGRTQQAAGIVVYGPQTSLVLSLGRGTHIFILDRNRGEFVLAKRDVQVPRSAREYAINASNYRHWDPPVRAYVDDCVLGADGPRGGDFNMRWIASLVAEAYRILVRGGIFLYPGDSRPGYRQGRLRLLYEAAPLAFLLEQAGGAATDGQTPILDLVPAGLHQRTPLVFGSADKVERVAKYHTDPHYSAERSPLFGKRGLLRA